MNQQPIAYQITSPTAQVIATMDLQASQTVGQPVYQPLMWLSAGAITADGQRRHIRADASCRITPIYPEVR